MMQRTRYFLHSQRVGSRLSPANFSPGSRCLSDKNLTHGSNDQANISEVTKHSTTPSTDEFTKEFLKNQIKLSGAQKVILSIGSSLASLLDPTRHDMIACLGETTGHTALENILQTMKSNKEGKSILEEKPRINTKTIDLDKLRKLPDNTFGRAYIKFLDDNKVTPDSRMEVRFIEDPEIAYVMTRYRECHDLVHTILGMPTNMLGEVSVKWFEALNTGLPMCYGGAVFGAVRLRPKQRQLYSSKFLPWAISNGKSAKPLMTVYWEKRFDQDLQDLQNELGITPLDTNV